jgi:hypothetical protein
MQKLRFLFYFVFLEDFWKENLMGLSKRHRIAKR